MTTAQLLLATALVACGGSSNPPLTYSVGGAVSGLGSGGSVVLQNNGGDSLTVNANGAFTFATRVTSGGAYTVTVLTQPSGQSCTVMSGSATMLTGNVDTVGVTCTNLSDVVWTWMSGADTPFAAGVYGTLGKGAAVNVPGSRGGAISWADSAGNRWLFGGYGHDMAGLAGQLNDLWRYTSSTQQWTWMSGANTQGAHGVYGTLGTGAAANVPGARSGAISWTDSAGNLWLFGGASGDDSEGITYFNDLWQYTPSTSQWTWVSGANTQGAQGVYGTLGTGAAANVPGAREGAISWTDSAGNLWLFGGYGSDSIGAVGQLNDLWKYTPSTQQWTWVSGATTQGTRGVYGTPGTRAPSVPGARYGAVSWTDSAGNLWLFGGVGSDSTGTVGQLNDLWQYTPSTSQWTWVSGANTRGAQGVYDGTVGTGSVDNVPGARYGAVSWTDSAGNLWLFGGSGPAELFEPTDFGDLWKYTPSTQLWTWAGGPSGPSSGGTGTYGTLGTGSATNVPGPRHGAASWTDSAGNLWLFGGLNSDGNGGEESYNDLWRGRGAG